MEYDKFLVSLYESGGHNSLPSLFIEVFKQSDRCVLKLNLFKEKQGWLFVYLEKNCLCVDLKKAREFIFNADFFNQNEYLFVIRSLNKMYVGERGKVSAKEKKIEGINKKYNELLEKKKEQEKVDKNQIVDDIVQKMFSDQSFMFFEQTKKQLNSLFSTSKRAKELEEKIAFSKFAKSYSGGETHYAGVVYKNNQVYAIGVGQKENLDDLKLVSGNSYQFFDSMSQGKNEDYGVFMMFRRASDGDVVFL